MAMSAELALLQRVCILSRFDVSDLPFMCVLAWPRPRRGVLVRVSLAMSQQRGLVAYDATQYAATAWSHSAMPCEGICYAAAAAGTAPWPCRSTAGIRALAASNLGGS